jgi:heme oxygenase
MIIGTGRATPRRPAGAGTNVDTLPSEMNDQARAPGLAQRMRERTASLHRQAERSGIVCALLSGNATVAEYALYLRNLVPAYQAMELALRRHRARTGFAYLAQRSLHRAELIVTDLDDLAGSCWGAALPLLPAGERYAAALTQAGGGSGELLIAHAYTRYLGDLSGGQILRGRLLRHFGPDFRATAFTEFPAITAIGDFVAGFRSALNEAGEAVTDPDLIVEEAAVAFQMNIRLSEDVASFSRHTGKALGRNDGSEIPGSCKKQ